MMGKNESTSAVRSGTQQHSRLGRAAASCEQGAAGNPKSRAVPGFDSTPSAPPSNQRTYLQKYMADRRALLKATGTCTDCGKNKAVKNKTLCQKCLDARKRRWHEGAKPPMARLWS
jgi:hypothetical protein